MDIKLILLIAVLIVVAAMVFYFLNKVFKNKQNSGDKAIKTFEQREIEFDAELRYEYSAALQSGDKEKALALGRKYYQSLRGGEPTEIDERAIAKGISTMRQV